MKAPGESPSTSFAESIRLYQRMTPQEAAMTLVYFYGTSIENVLACFYHLRGYRGTVIFVEGTDRNQYSGHPHIKMKGYTDGLRFEDWCYVMHSVTGRTLN